MNYDRKARTSLLGIGVAIGICTSSVNYAHADIDDPIIIVRNTTAFCNAGGVCCEVSNPLQVCCLLVAGEGSCTSQGLGSMCLGNQACCKTDGSCVDVDRICCDDVGGVAQGSGTSCAQNACPGGTVACCLPAGCQNLSAGQCASLGGSSGGAGSACEGVQSCCDAIAESCTDVDAACCTGTAGGAGSACNEACCLPGDSCEDADPACCAELGGVSRGPGTACDDPDATCGLQGCCVGFEVGGSDFCDNCNYFLCTTELDGTPLGVDSEGIVISCNNIPDGDGDGIADLCDNCPVDDNSAQEDTDECEGGSEHGKMCASDDDCLGGGVCAGDGVGDLCDNCEDKLNPDQADSDAECADTGTACGPTSGNTCAAGVACITDDRGDACDNCPFDLNPNQKNCDGDDDGDACDGDIDNDGVLNDDDVCDCTPPSLPVFTAVGHPLRGQSIFDLDGDCDVDDDDVFLLSNLAVPGSIRIDENIEFEGYCVCEAP